MKKITIVIDTKEDNERIRNILYGWFRDNFEESLVKEINVEDVK